MPNHVRQKLKIHGEKTELKRFLDFIKSEESDFDFDKIIPIPKDGSVLIKDSFSMEEMKMPNALDWQTENWGTKWNAYKLQVLNHEWNIVIKFATAWNAPTPILDKLYAEFPELEFIHISSDEGQDAIITYTEKDRKEVIKFNSEDVIEAIYQALNDNY